MDPFLTPDGAFRVDFEWFEMRMSHWVYNPRVTHLPTGRVVLNLFGTMMDATCSVDENGRLRLFLREYPGNQPGYEVLFDPRTGDQVEQSDVPPRTPRVSPPVQQIIDEIQSPPQSPPPPEPPADTEDGPAAFFDSEVLRPSSEPHRTRIMMAPPRAHTPVVVPVPTVTRPRTRPEETDPTPRRGHLPWLHALVGASAIAVIFALSNLLASAWLLSSLPAWARTPAANVAIGAIVIGGGFALMLWLFRTRPGAD